MKILMLGIDVVLAAIIILSVWIVNYLMPQKGISVKDATKSLQHTSTVNAQSDKSEAGKHLAYGTKTAYVLADVYIGDISCFQTAFAQDTYGVGNTEKLSDMSARMQSILAVNGDSYSNNRHRDNGTIIRNGVVYRAKQSDAETCVLNQDGTMDILNRGITVCYWWMEDRAVPEGCS